MIPITIYRSDFKENKDSEGWPYFYYLLAALGFKETIMDKVEEVNIFFVKTKIYDSDGRELKGEKENDTNAVERMSIYIRPYNNDFKAEFMLRP